MRIQPRRSIWTAFAEHARRGVALVVTVPRDALLPPQPIFQPRNIKRDVKGPERPFLHTRLKTITGHKMRCRNPGCTKELRSQARSIVCGEKCFEALRYRCQHTLDILEGRLAVEEFDTYFRGRLIRPRKHRPPGSLVELRAVPPGRRAA